MAAMLFRFARGAKGCVSFAWAASEPQGVRPAGSGKAEKHRRHGGSLITHRSRYGAL